MLPRSAPAPGLAPVRPALLFALVLATGCAVEEGAEPPTPPPASADGVWLALASPCGGLLAVGAEAELTVHHPGIDLSAVWSLQVISGAGVAELTDGSAPDRGRLSNIAEASQFTLRCVRAGQARLRVETQAGSPLSELTVTCVPPEQLPLDCGGEEAMLDMGSPEPDAGDAATPDQTPIDAGAAVDLGPARLTVAGPPSYRLSWPLHPVDDAPGEVVLTARVERDGVPVEGAWLGALAHNAPVSVEPTPTDAEGRAEVRVRPLGYRGTGALRLSARLPDDRVIEGEDAITFTTVSAPVSQLLLRCDAPRSPGLAQVDPAGGIARLADAELGCRVLALDNAGGAVPNAAVVLQAEAGRVPSDVVTDATGAAHFRWWTDGSLPYRRYDEISPADVQVALLAVTTGREAFTDHDGHPGSFNRGVDSQEPSHDLGEPFLDLNGDGEWTDSLPRSTPGGERRAEPWVDRNSNRVRDEPNGAWDAEADIWDSLELTWTGPSAAATSALLPPEGARVGCPDAQGVWASPGQRYAFVLQASDAYGHCPWGTARISLTGQGRLVGTPAEIDLAAWCGDDNRPQPIPIEVEFDDPRSVELNVVLEGEPDAAPVRLSYRMCRG